MIEVAVFGFGNIGGGVVDVIENNQEQIRRTLPEGMHIKYILDIREFPESPYRDRIVHDVDVIINDPEIKVVCETMGGKEPAFTFSKKALEKGISVCSSNKELVEAFGPELLKTAREHHCSYLFEASVGGGIPLLHPIVNCLQQEKITSIIGILNGTTNYILTKMAQEGADYAQVLKEAQELGYAEKNPAADVEGYDTGRKIAILSSLMCGHSVKFDDIYVEGITKISQADFEYAERKNYSIKLLGVSRRDGEDFEVMTAPYLVPENHPLYAVSDVFNGVLVTGNMVDELMFYGRGAGKHPTGSAVVSDMINAAKSAGKTLAVDWSGEIRKPTPQGDCENAFFVRVKAEDEQKARQQFGSALSQVWENPSREGEFAFVTGMIRENEFDKKTEGLNLISKIRILSDAR